MALEITLPKWYDLHVHLRQEDMVAPLVKAQLEMGCCGVLAMPNTRPPAAKIFLEDHLPYKSIEEYRQVILEAGGDAFNDIIVPLYLTKDTSPKMIEAGAKAGFLQACKYYPPHGTTGADFGYPFAEFMENGVFKAMEEAGIVLCIHGEQHGLGSEDYFDRNKNAEEIFYSKHLPGVHEKFPALKIVGEHVTTKAAKEFIAQAGDNVAATITPQHLLYTVGHLLKGCNYHLYCLPLLKFEEDRQALRDAVIDPANKKFFAGTDSAPHTEKATDCGCAAGCFTGAIAPQLYAQGFEEAGVDLSTEAGQETFKKFLCTNGPDFYGLKHSEETFTLVKEKQKVSMLDIPGTGKVTPLPLGLGEETIAWSVKISSP